MSRRARRHEQTIEEIKQAARQQMAKQGTAAALSLRGIAAEMGMSGPSLYNYYANRDALVTDLLVDSYTHQAEVLEKACAACQGQEAADCLLATVLAYRQWVKDHPDEFTLIAGNPIPGYVAPMELTLPLGRRSTKVLLDILQRAWEEHLERQRRPQSSFPDSLLGAFNEDFCNWCREQGYTLSVVVQFLELYAWLQGMLALEVFGHLPFFLNDPVAFYRTVLLTWFASATA